MEREEFIKHINANGWLQLVKPKYKAEKGECVIARMEKPYRDRPFHSELMFFSDVVLETFKRYINDEFVEECAIVQATKNGDQFLLPIDNVFNVKSSHSRVCAKEQETE